MSKITRKLSVIAAFLVLFGGVFAMQFLAKQKEPPPPKAKTVKTAREVKTMEVKNQMVANSLDIQGRLVAFDKIDIFAEVSGTLENTSRAFKVGNYFKKGAVLIKINQDEARLNLLAQRSSLLNAITQMLPDLKIDYTDSFDQWKNYVDQFDPEKPIQPFPKSNNDQEKYFIASKNILNQYYTIKSTETRLAKYTIYAPFSGVLTATDINPGSLVRVGQKLGELMNTGNYELEAAVALSDLRNIKVGNTVQLRSDAIDGEWTGRIKRIDNQIDPTSQTVKLFIGVSGQNLREGMYLIGDVKASPIDDAVRIPRDLLIDQKAVYAVRDSQLILEDVSIVKISGPDVIIKGLDDGTVILKKPVNGAFVGMKVRELRENYKLGLN